MESRGKKSQRRERVRRKKMQARKKVESREALKHCVFLMSCGSGGAKSKLAKACGETRDDNLHAVVVRSRFGSQKAKNASRPEHF